VSANYVLGKHSGTSLIRHFSQADPLRDVDEETTRRVWHGEERDENKDKRSIGGPTPPKGGVHGVRAGGVSPEWSSRVRPAVRRKRA